MENKGAKKLLFVSSSGGHWEELMCLRTIAEANDTIFVTEAGSQADEFKGGRVMTYPQINRRQKGFFMSFMKLMKQASALIKKEKPDAVISTGALVSVPFCIAAKLHGAKVIYIESFARVNGKSLTGKIMYHFADLFIVQWEALLPLYPKAVYAGSIF